MGWNQHRYEEGVRAANDVEAYAPTLLKKGLANDEPSEYGIGFGDTVVRRLRKMGEEKAAAQVCLRTNLDALAWGVLRRLEDADEAYWTPDPEVPNVWALAKRNMTPFTVLAVVYLNEGSAGDYELSGYGEDVTSRPAPSQRRGE